MEQVWRLRSPERFAQALGEGREHHIETDADSCPIARVALDRMPHVGGGHQQRVIAHPDHHLIRVLGSELDDRRPDDAGLPSRVAKLMVSPLGRRAPAENIDDLRVPARLPAHAFLIGFASVIWRETWKYGERAFRYCQHDVGHVIGSVRIAAQTLGWRMTPLAGQGEPAESRRAGAMGDPRSGRGRVAEVEHGAESRRTESRAVLCEPGFPCGPPLPRSAERGTSDP